MPARRRDVACAASTLGAIRDHWVTSLDHVPQLQVALELRLRVDVSCTPPMTPWKPVLLLVSASAKLVARPLLRFAASGRIYAGGRL